MEKYRCRNTTVEAIQFTGYNIREVTEFIDGFGRVHDCYMIGLHDFSIKGIVTSAGKDQTISAGDFLIKDSVGNLCVCSAYAFHYLYEECQE